MTPTRWWARARGSPRAAPRRSSTSRRGQLQVGRDRVSQARVQARHRRLDRRRVGGRRGPSSRSTTTTPRRGSTTAPQSTPRPARQGGRDHPAPGHARRPVPRPEPGADVHTSSGADGRRRRSRRDGRVGGPGRHRYLGWTTQQAATSLGFLLTVLRTLLRFGRWIPDMVATTDDGCSRRRQEQGNGPGRAARSRRPARSSPSAARCRSEGGQPRRRLDRHGRARQHRAPIRSSTSWRPRPGRRRARVREHGEHRPLRVHRPDQDHQHAQARRHGGDRASSASAAPTTGSTSTCRRAPTSTTARRSSRTATST